MFCALMYLRVRGRWLWRWWLEITVFRDVTVCSMARVCRNVSKFIIEYMASYPRRCSRAWHVLCGKVAVIGVIWGGGGKFPPIFFRPKNSFFCILSWRGGKMGMSGGEGCMCVKDWFKPIFRIFVIWLLCKLKFLITHGRFCPHPQCY
jgi:hypothetical protein